MRISLAQTGRWLVGRGQVPEAALKDVPKEFTPAELERWSMTAERRVAGLSDTPPRWARPSVPLGYHPPAWPPRAT